MGPRSREGVSAYISAFVLIGIAIGGSAVVFGAVSAYSSELNGPAVSIERAGVRQGSYFALETLIVFDSGETKMTSFTVSTNGVSAGAAYCYSLLNPTTGAQLFTTCPDMTTDPSVVTVSYVLSPGNAVLVEITLPGTAFSVGSRGALTVTTSGGAQQTVGILVEPA